MRNGKRAFLISVITVGTLIVILTLSASLTSSNVEIAGSPTKAVPLTQDFLPPPSKDQLAYTDEGTPEQIACAKRADNVRVAYQPRRTMTVGQQEQIKVVVTTKEGDVVLPGKGSVTIVNASFGCTIEARIIGGTAFEVDPKDVERRSFLRDNAVSFSWIVTPKRTGTDVLELQVQGVVDPGYSQYATNPQSFTAEITVQAKPRSVGTKAYDWSAAVVDFPLVKGAGVLAAAIAAWGGIVKMRKKKKGALDETVLP